MIINYILLYFIMFSVYFISLFLLPLLMCMPYILYKKYQKYVSNNDILSKIKSMNPTDFYLLKKQKNILFKKKTYHFK